MTILLAFLALTACLSGMAFAYTAWRRETRARLRMAGALACWLVSVALWARAFGAEVGIPLALETASLIAFGFILTRMERRESRAVRDRVVPPVPPARHARLRGSLRVLIAGPLGLVGALGLGILFATQAPLAEQTRLILGGLIVPSLWCGAMAWTASDRRLLPQALTFTAAGAAGFGLALLPGA